MTLKAWNYFTFVAFKKGLRRGFKIQIREGRVLWPDLGCNENPIQLS